MTFKGLHTVKMGERQYYYAWRGGPRIEAEFGTPEFAASFEQAHRSTRPSERREGPKREALRHYVANQLLVGARRRARADAIAFDLTKADMVQLLSDDGYCCAVTGLQFSMFRTGLRQRLFRYPFRPSLDRIEPAKGYTKGNVRLVCWAVNVALGDWGEDVFLAIALGLLKHGSAAERKRAG